MAEEIKINPILSVRELAVSYGKLAALRGVNLEIPAGQITALVGPSGCGKTTFLGSLNRLIDLIPNCRREGRILFGNRDIFAADYDVLSLRRRIGMVFQKPNPFAQSITRNFEIPLREHGFSKIAARDRMVETLQNVGLWKDVSDRLHTNAANLSGGQQQRLCIARALALDPEVILFDEPCSALDPQSSAVVEDLITGLRGKVTVIIVTHNLAQARRMADQLAVFWTRDGVGTIVEKGPAEAIFCSPTDPDATNYLSGARG